MTTRRRWLAAGAALVAAGGVVWALAGRRLLAPPAPRNVLLILVDTLRADHLGAYGYARPTSPSFDALATSGLLFSRAHSTTSWTNPAVASLFTGEHPRVIQPGAKQFIAPNERTLATAFHQAGYQTAAFIANPVIPPDLGFAQGFEAYVGVSGWVHGWEKVETMRAERVNGDALAWLQHAAQDPRRPWFLYLQYMDAHWPYKPPRAVAERFWRSKGIDLATAVDPINRRVRKRTGLTPTEVQQAVDLYDADVADLDAQLGSLLATLRASGQLSNTLLCIVADHGEELDDHGAFLHAHTLFEEVLHIPLLIVPPGTPRPARIDRLVQITSVGRTLLDLAGLPTIPFPGTSLLAEPTPGSTAGVAFAELLPGFLLGADHQYALLTGHQKLIVTPSGERLLFDLTADPGEHSNVAASEPALTTELDQLLAQAIAAKAQHTPAVVDPATRERLKALGYDF